jgi:hypothetical protein
MRGPSIDWGLILLKPSEMMGDTAHGHNIIDDKEYLAPQGSVFLCEPKEMHNIRNDSDKQIKIVFIKGDYKPDDKI